MKKIFVLIFILLLAFTFSTLTRGQQTENQPEIQSPINTRKVYLGAWVGGFWDNDNKNLNTQVLSEFEKNIDRKVSIANIYSEWSYLSNPDLISKLNEISDNGWTPIISSNPFFFEDCKDTGDPLYKTIASGACDEFLKQVAANLKSFEKPLFFRFAWEMNLPDMYWSIEKTKSTPDDFRQAWRRFYDVLKGEEADKVVWVLSFNTSHAKTVPYKDLYPGDEYVDWVAIDGYNWGNSHEWASWANFSGVFYNSYDELIKISKKPVMLSEVNSAPSEYGGDKAQWLDDMLTVQIPDKYKQIGAIVFFNEEKEETESVDWRLEKSDEYLKVVRNALKNSLYKSSYP